jgi:uncharacterized protein
MRAVLLRAELQFPGVRSLKEKRRPLKSLVAQLQNRFHCAVAEVDHQDLHQRTALGIAFVGADGKHLARMEGEVRGFLERGASHLVLDVQSRVVDGPEAFAAFDRIGEAGGPLPEWGNEGPS